MIVLVGSGGHADDIAATLGDYRAYAHHEDVREFGSDDSFIIGVNNPSLRAAIAESLGVFDTPWIHPHARLYVDVVYGVGTHINYGAMMTRTRIGHHCTIAPGVHMAGDIAIGDRVYIGIGAIILNLLTIGDDAIIGAGAVVLHDIPAGETWAGNPARRIR